MGVDELQEEPEGEEETERLSFCHREVRRGLSCVAELITVAMK